MQVNQTELPLDDVHLSVTQSFPNSDSQFDSDSDFAAGTSTVGWQKEIEVGTSRARLSVALPDRFPIGGQKRIRFDIVMMTRFQTYTEVIKLFKESDKQYKVKMHFYTAVGKKPYEQTMTLGIVSLP